MTDDLPEIESIGRLNLGPDDVLIVTVPGRITPEQAARIRGHVRDALRTDRVLILSDGARVDVAELPANQEGDGA